jgi:acetolactate synthase I/II/III large subunit
MNDLAISSPLLKESALPESRSGLTRRTSGNPARTAAEHVLDVLEEFGVDTVFGIIGGAVSSLYGGLLDRPRISVVSAKHETSAVFLAMGYAMATGKLGTVITTAGPGITNALTGLASAYYENVPLLMLSGEVPTTIFGRGAFQEGSASEFDALSMVRRVTKFAAQVTRPGTAATLARKAVTASLSGRGPSFLSLPLDVSSSRPGPATSVAGSSRTHFDVDVEGCRQAVSLLLNARRPLVIAGAGARGAANRKALRDFVAQTQVPVAVTPKAKGVFPEDHPLYLGVLGLGGHESVTRYLSEGVDVLLVCGSRLSDFSTNGWSPILSASTAFIQIDIDLAQIGRNYPVDVGLLGPIDAVLGEMSLSANRQVKPRMLGGPELGLQLQPLRTSMSGALTTADVMLALNELCPRDAVFTSDIGEHLSMAVHYLSMRAQNEFITCLGFGSMGSGICTAIGYQMGAPSRRVYAICGDGCFLMYGSELTTAVKHGVPVTIVVINDGRLNMCHHGMQDMFGRTPDLTTPLVDFAAIARGMGADGVEIRSRADLFAALSAPPNGRPLLLDVRVDPDVRLEGNPRDAALRQFKAPKSVDIDLAARRVEVTERPASVEAVR